MPYPHKVIGKTDNDYVIEVICILCHSPRTCAVPHQAYYNWNSAGMLIQRAMPTVSPEDRELLISGTCMECWKKLFASDDDDE